VQITPGAFVLRSVIAAAALAAWTGAADADEFYKGKELTLIIGSDAGAGYDAYGRLVGKYLVDHLAGKPIFVARNMPGAGGRRGLSYIYNVAAKDGTVIGTTLRTVPIDPILRSNETFDFDATKIGWLGSANNEVSTCLVWHTAPAHTIEQARTTELTFGSTGPSSNETLQAVLLNAVLGTRIRVVHGYKSSSEVMLAAERGEMDGRCGFGWDSVVSRYKEVYDQKKLIILVQLGLNKHPDIPEVPFIMDLVKTPEDRQIVELFVGPNEMGRPFFAPPDLPAGRLAELRAAFDAAMTDKAMLEAASKANMAISAMTGQQVEALMLRMYQTPDAVRKRTVALIEEGSAGTAMK
jgi:tripartite-type tricarboxylate transporter receptor subunit TctC